MERERRELTPMMEWVEEVNRKLECMPEAAMENEKWKKRSIYKLSKRVLDLHPQAYMPQVASFGPYHRHDAHLRSFQEHKERALLHLLRRSGKALRSFVDSVSEVVEDLKDSYDALDGKWLDNTEAFLKLMIVDGCCMLEILRTAGDFLNDYAENDPIFSNHGKLHVIPFIKRDMLMLENQIPMQVLERLLSVGENGSKNDVIKLIVKFYSPGMPGIPQGKCLHVLDAYRKSLVAEETCGNARRVPSARQHQGIGDDVVWTATEIHNAGINFKKSKSECIKDVRFHQGSLTLPLVVVDDATESKFLNMIAFEQYHVGASNDVSGYIFFMDCLIDSSNDVALLESKGIIQNALGSDKAVANLFNSLSKDITLDPDGSLNTVHRMVNEYCKQPWNSWRANLIHTYFRSPWALISLIAAIFLFALTILQTVFTVRPNASPGEHSPAPRRPRL